MGCEEGSREPEEAPGVVRGGESAFSDERGLVIDDPEHSDEEDRFVLLGMSAALRVLVVCHCYRVGGDVIRLISARRADPQEQQDYFDRWRP